MSASDSEGEETVLPPELVPLLENQLTSTTITTIPTPINSASSTTVSIVSSNNLPPGSNTNNYNSSGGDGGGVISLAATTNDITNSTITIASPSSSSSSSSLSSTSTSATTTSVVSDSSTGNSRLPATDKSQAKVKSLPAAKTAALACCHSRKLSLNGNSSFQNGDDVSLGLDDYFIFSIYLFLFYQFCLCSLVLHRNSLHFFFFFQLYNIIFVKS